MYRNISNIKLCKESKAFLVRWIPIGGGPNGICVGTLGRTRIRTPPSRQSRTWRSWNSRRESRGSVHLGPHDSLSFLFLFLGGGQETSTPPAQTASGSAYCVFVCVVFVFVFWGEQQTPSWGQRRAFNSEGRLNSRQRSS